ncbi:homeobox domain-containing protein [Trichoderma harzianum]|uniref:Homeobox domain-containing protein n=1 Tax=Trichoderma harzianum TaxID=5544 RepID=A0A0G0A2K0_TRIHA|nr:homeobox domain-containing protein [Trichoderma harzianum]
MLATRSCDPEHSHWSLGKYFPAPGKASTSPRMSDQYDSSLQTQPDWQGQYPYLSQPAGSAYSQPSESNHANSGVVQPQSMAQSENLRLEAHADRQSTLTPSLHHNTYRGAAEDHGHPSRLAESSERKEESRSMSTTSRLLDEPVPTARAITRDSAPSGYVNSTSTMAKGLGNPSDRFGPDDQRVVVPKDEEDALLDEDMPEDEADSLLQTAAERVAARRKMKRFRLTHQQTRFLTSEFAKQPHPDAAHRERLSREIPGLSPRQVQVWFQNRRAKIKRLNADDRDRMIKMRAVPDDFDNVQALHSPYGAVHMPMPLAAPVDFGHHPPYPSNSMRAPLMVDVRRQEGPGHMSPTGLTPSFGNIGFYPSNAVNSSGVMSPISPHSSERYPPHGSGGPHGPLDAHRHGVRPLQTFHNRDPVSRPRSESLQLHYMHPGVNTHSSVSDRSSLVYQPGQMSQAAPSSAGGVDRSPYASGSNAQSSPTGLSYPNFQQTSENGSRLRAASASLPLNTTDHYRTLQSPQSHNHRTAGSTSQYGASSTYQASYGAAPLSAPLTPSLAAPPPRTSATPSSVRDYPDSVGTPGFPQTLQSSLNGHDSRTDSRSVYPSGAPDYANNQQRNDSYGINDLNSAISLKRDRGYITQGGATSPLDRARPSLHHSTS